MKKCTSCTESDVTKFTRDSRNKSGLQSQCKNCRNEARNKKYSEDEEYRNSQKEKQLKYGVAANKRAKEHVSNLTDFYVIASLKRGTNLTTEDIKKTPHLIELKKQIILNKRLCRELKT